MFAVWGCGATHGMTAASATQVPAGTHDTTTSTRDTSETTLVPAGYGTLHQDDLALHVDGPGVLVRALPLDESIIRLLTPDSYRALRDLQVSHRDDVDAIARRNGGRVVSVWLVSFYGLTPDARFTPLDVLVTSGGREFRAYDVIPLTIGFGEQRLKQRDTQSALYVYDGDVEVDQPLTVTYAGAKDESWEQTLQRIERERAMVRARAIRRENHVAP